MPYISFIIPSYKSSIALKQNLPYLLSAIKEKNWDAEVVIVDDGSNDHGETKKIAQQHQCQYISYPNNLGKGAAVRKGMQQVKGEIKIFTDADIPFESDAIDRIIHYIEIKEYDLVIGDRGLKESNYFNKISHKRRFGSGFFTFIVGRFVTTGISDTQCGLKGFRKEIADELFGVAQINGMAFDVELVYIALKRNFDIKKIPVSLRSQDGNSVRILKHGFRMLLDLFRIKMFHLKGVYNKK